MGYRLLISLWIPILWTSTSTFGGKLEIRWRRPRVLGYPGHYINFVNTRQYFLKLHKRVYFDACPPSEDGRPLYQWTVYDLNQTTLLYHKNTTECRHGWTAPEEGQYMLEARKDSANGTLIATATESFFVKDIWLVALGDSFASGQGNPDKWGGKTKDRPALWVNNTCYRASYGSFAYLTYEKIVQAYPGHGVLFTYLACSEATVQHGLMGSQPYQEAQVTSLLHPITLVAKNGSKRVPDLVLLTIGANDIGFFDVALDVLIGTLAINSSFNRLGLSGKFGNLTRDLHALHDELVKYGVDSADVFYFEYFDPLRNERGELDSNCAGLLWATDADFRVAYEQVLLPLNALIREQSKILGWNLVEGIAEAFRTHGYCSKDPYIRTVDESLEVQGAGFGAFHPTYAGHQVVADLAWPKIKGHLEKKMTG